jgi:RNA polymerase sigma factor FliA
MHALQTDRDALIHGHLDMARRIARKVARRVPRSIGCDELEGAAMLGLTEAASRFDSSRGEPFVAYAAKRVRGAILDELRRHDVLTRRGREGARRLAEATRAVEARTGRPAASEEIAREMDVSLEEVARFKARLQAAAVVSLDDLPAGRATEDDSPAEMYAHAEDKARLVEALRGLPERDAMILSMCYQDGLTLKEIGEILGVTESRVCQLRSRSLRQLRAALAA